MSEPSSPGSTGPSAPPGERDGASDEARRGGRPGPETSRAMAARVLLDVEEQGARANGRLVRELDVAEGLPRDRALATELVYGVLRWRRRLDHALRPRVRQRLEALEPVARTLLRIGAYQVLWLDRVPVPVAVSATQNAARRLGAPRLTGLLNAVLRKVAKAGEELPTGADSASLGIRTSLPDWVAETLQRVHGDEAEREAMALRERARTTLRPNPVRGGLEAARGALAEAGFEVSEGPEGVLIVSGGDVFRTPAFERGLFVAQDPASLRVVAACEPREGLEVLDLCAGTGVKATALAERGADVTAVDVNASKLERARELAERHGVAERIRTRALDAASGEDDAALEALGSWPVVLVDAPCTGLGTLRHHPEIAWRHEPADAARLADLQARLLARAAERVEPGGVLVYAVCTFTEAETAPPVPEGLEPEGEPVRTRASEGLDAFFLQRFRKR